MAGQKVNDVMERIAEIALPERGRQRVLCTDSLRPRKFSTANTHNIPRVQRAYLFQISLESLVSFMSRQKPRYPPRWQAPEPLLLPPPRLCACCQLRYIALRTFSACWRWRGKEIAWNHVRLHRVVGCTQMYSQAREKIVSLEGSIV